MIIISVRDSLDGDDKYGPDFSCFDLSFTGHSTSDQNKRTFASVKKLLKGKRVLLLIHGYNNDFSDVCRAYNKIETNLNETGHDYDEIVGFTWPGGDKGYDYFAAKRRSSVAAARLLDLMGRVDFGVLDVMSHSMGARIVYRALTDAPEDGSYLVRNHFSTAAAIEDEHIEKGERYYSGTRLVEFNWIFHSRHDLVLKVWYQAGELDTPLGLHGPDDVRSIERHSKNVKIINCKKYVKGHGDYKNSIEFHYFVSYVLYDQLPVSRQFFNL